MIAALASPVVWTVALVALQRVAELVVSAINTRRLLARGAREAGRAHYPLFVLLHASWLVAILLAAPSDRWPEPILISLFIVLQLARVWVIATLGPYWTTRIITLDRAPLVTGGPFRFVRHPNYLIVAAEIAVLPLAFGVWWVAVLLSGLNAALLRHRIAVEMATLATREAPAPST